MNKEEIKKTIKIIFNEECKKCYFPRKRSCESCLKENRKKIRKYIKELEQKETILDKVTDKLKEDIEKYNKELTKNNILSMASTDLAARALQSQKILNIIEGEKK